MGNSSSSNYDATQMQSLSEKIDTLNQNSIQVEPLTKAVNRLCDILERKDSGTVSYATKTSIGNTSSISDAMIENNIDNILANR